MIRAPPRGPRKPEKPDLGNTLTGLDCADKLMRFVTTSRSWEVKLSIKVSFLKNLTCNPGRELGLRIGCVCLTWLTTGAGGGDTVRFRYVGGADPIEEGEREFAGGYEW